ncbi:MAG TPA: hypothetical protein VI248_20465 [Kineosporiaceae bacterium]
MTSLGALLLASAGTLLAGSAPASATVCTTRGCGGIVRNNSSGLVRVSNNWCWGNKYVYYGNTLPCATTWSSTSYKSFFLLGHPDDTTNYYYYYDTDAFRVDARCKMTTWSGTHVIYDNSTSDTPMWVKINNDSDVTITLACW